MPRIKLVRKGSVADRRRIIEELKHDEAKYLGQARARVAELHMLTAISKAEAKHQMVAIARDLLPKAAGLARKGKPRLLAVVSKILYTPGPL